MCSCRKLALNAWKAFSRISNENFLSNSFTSSCFFVAPELMATQKNGLMKKVLLVLTFMTSQSEKQTIALYTVPNISRSKSNQTMRLGQLIECNMRNIFLEKSHTKWGGETSPKSYSKKTKLSISQDQMVLKLYRVCFCCTPSWGLSKHLETKLQTTCFFLI